MKPVTLPSTIEGVISALKNIISNSISDNDRAGYFASLYLKVTESVAEGIRKGQFDNAERMEHLDVIFAGRYLDAYFKWKKGEEMTTSWKLAFDTCRKGRPLVLQQLLLGMSAHINLDLGIAAVEVSKPGQLKDLHNDFDKINTIISSLTYEVLSDLGRISPLLSLLGLHAGNSNSVLIQFSINNARDGAWCFAEELSEMIGPDYDKCVRNRDSTIYTLGKNILEQKGLLKFTAWLIHLFEWKKPARIIKVLNTSSKKHFTIDRHPPAGKIDIAD